MALRYLETFHGISTDFYPARTQLMTQKNVDVGSSGFIDGPGTAGRFPGTTGFQDDGASYSNIIVFGADYLRSDMIRFALDIKGYNTATERFIAGVYNNAASSGTGTQSPNASSAFFIVLFNTATNRIVVKKETTLVAVNTVIASSTNTYPTFASQYHHVEVEANIATGTIRVFVNDALEIDLSGLTFPTTGDIQSLGFGGGRTAISTLAVWDDAGTGGFKGVIGDFKAVQLVPNGAGDSADSSVTGAPTRHEAVDETFSDGQTSYISLPLDGSRDLYQYSDVAAEDTGVVLTVVAQPVTWKKELGSGTVRVVASSGGNVQVSDRGDPLVPFAGSYGQRYTTKTFNTDPNTGSAWTVAGVNAAQFGVEADVEEPI